MEDKVFQYLETLRRSGEINMLGATPFIQIEFSLSVTEAKKLLVKWIKLKK